MDSRPSARSTQHQKTCPPPGITVFHSKCVNLTLSCQWCDRKEPSKTDCRRIEIRKGLSNCRCGVTLLPSRPPSSVVKQIGECRVVRFLFFSTQRYLTKKSKGNHLLSGARLHKNLPNQQIIGALQSQETGPIFFLFHRYFTIHLVLVLFFHLSLGWIVVFFFCAPFTPKTNKQRQDSVVNELRRKKPFLSIFFGIVPLKQNPFLTSIQVMQIKEPTNEAVDLNGEKIKKRIV